MIWIIIGIFMVIFCVHRLYLWWLPKLAEYYLRLTGSYIGAVEASKILEAPPLRHYSIQIITPCFRVEYNSMNKEKFLSFLNKKGKIIEIIRHKLEQNKKIISDNDWEEIDLYSKTFKTVQGMLDEIT